MCLSSNLVEIKKSASLLFMTLGSSKLTDEPVVYLFLISYGRTKHDQLPMVIPRMMQVYPYTLPELAF
jgi:hypothetical protein